MIPLLATFTLGFAMMLSIMGIKQWERRYRIAASFSLVTAVMLAIAGVWMLVVHFSS